MSFIKIKDPRRREELIKKLIETRKRIKDNFIARKVGESEYQTGLTKLFKPVTETQKATAKEITDAQKEAVQKIMGELLPIREGLQNLTIIPPIEAGEETLPAIEITKEEMEKYGPTAAQYLKKYLSRDPNVDKSKAGIYSDKGNLKIGSKPLKIENDDIIIDDERFEGTPGLWKLITSENIPDISEYEAKDLYNYIFIMTNTNTAHINYDPNQKYRGGNNNKMNNLIKPFVKVLNNKGDNALVDEINKHYGLKEETDEETDENDPQPSTSGTGLKILPSDPNALLDRFDLLFSNKKAGHTGVRNEIVSILDELKRQGVINTKEYKKLNSLIKK